MTKVKSVRISTVDKIMAVKNDSLSETNSHLKTRAQENNFEGLHCWNQDMSVVSKEKR